MVQETSRSIIIIFKIPLDIAYIFLNKYLNIFLDVGSPTRE